MRFARIAGLLAAAVMLAATGAAWGAAYNVGPVNSTDATAVPDVNKNPFPPAADDYGCWAAAASDVLAAAGWGTGGNAAARAANIYQDFINHFKVNPGDTYIKATGDGASAVKWWVANVGLNQAATGSGYTPAATYVNFRLKNQTLFESDYNFLLHELNAGQYAMVHWQLPTGMGHCVTLVGGNYGPNNAPPANPAPPWTSVWHDSDSNGAGGVADQARNTYNFALGQNNTWFLDTNAVPTPNNTADDWFAEGYLTACPGVSKPASAIGNFDIHHYTGLALPVFNPTSGRFECNPTMQLTITGSNYGTYKGPGGAVIDPYWQDPTPTNPTPTLIVPNQFDQTRQKKLYVLVDFNDPVLVPKDGQGQPIAPAIQVIDDAGIVIGLTSAQWAADGGEVMMTYTFDSQPAWEQVVFPGAEYNNLWAANSNVFEWDIATECVPEPTTLALILFGAAGVISRRRRR